MKLNLDSHTLDLPCGGCGKKHSKTLAWLKANKQITCDCGATTTVDVSKFEQGLATAQKSLDGLQATLGKLGKR